MKKVYFRDGVLYYFGNPAGYLSGDKIIIDAMFRREELLRYLAESEGKEVVIQEGIYDRMPDSRPEAPCQQAGRECMPHRRDLRIYRLKPDRPALVRFASLAGREERGFGRPERREYDLVHECSIPAFDLEEIWDTFSRKGIGDYALSISDVVELAGNGASRFFYVDRAGFQEIRFKMQ